MFASIAEFAIVGKVKAARTLLFYPQPCDDRHMSEQPASPSGVPTWDVADRMRKALRYAGLSPGQMATYLDVGGNTVSTWINGRVAPSTQTLRLWALRCGVSYEWLAEDFGGGLPNRFPSRRGGSRSRERGVISTNISTRHLTLVA
jgi:transcriptional regulator with XRE-family HTH domain